MTALDHPEQLTEDEIRALRANIYGECTDGNWLACREKWMRPDSVTWLITHQD
jgi:hypothetical protein